MKKKIIVILVCMLAIFMVAKNVNAESNANFMETTQSCEKVNGKNVCTFGLKFYRDYTFSYPSIPIKFYLKSLYFDEGSTITPAAGWQVTNVNYSDNQIEVKRTGSFLANTEYPIVTVSFEIIENGEDCKVTWVPYITPNSYCHYDSNTQKYYGLSGGETTRAKYLEECYGSPACQERNLEEVGIVYTDKDGNEVSKEQYEAICKDNTCKIVNNEYYNKYGQKTDLSGYIKDCKTPCEILEDGTFIGDTNEIVNEDTYNAQCKYHCEYAFGKYYDKDGNETTKLNYEKTCFKNVCKKLSDGTYYNSKGEETDELTYQKECEKNICKVLSDGTYYDNNGKVVTKEEYEKSCNKCKEENGKYYDNDGKETNKENYELVCKVHKCQVINNTYFDDKGNIVTKEVYDKYCTNPKTGNIVPYIYTFLGMLTATGLFVYSKKHKKLNRI